MEPVNVTSIDALNYQYPICRFSNFMKKDMDNPENQQWWEEVRALKLDLTGYEDPEQVKTRLNLCKRIEELKIPHDFLEKAEPLLTNFPNLKRLDLSRPTATNWDYPDDESNCCNLIKSQNQLTHINLSHTCSASKVIEHIGRTCPLLTHMNLSGCVLDQKKGVSDLALGCRKLAVLNLTACGNAITDEALHTVAQGCSELQILNLTGCQYVTDKGMQEIAQGCSELQILDLTGCQYVTGKGIQEIAQMCHKLAVIRLTACYRVTPEGVLALAQCPKLREVDLKDCKGMTPQTLQPLVTKFPELTIVWK